MPDVIPGIVLWACAAAAAVLAYWQDRTRP